MTIDEKNIITSLRIRGTSYSQIAMKTGIKENTVKTFCRRKGVKPSQETILIVPRVTYGQCRECGVTVIQYPGRKEKKFCCDRCRNSWWNKHYNKVGRKTMTEYNCPVCGKVFYGYAKKNRKYCSHECYIKDRFG